jgi:2-dehydro-3-deoxyphosphogluconate aldolase / (4S)-4-hydroxy-2-oxoglutarate aldolase
VTVPVERGGRSTVVATLRDVGIIPVIRVESADAALAVVEVLAGAGLAVAEITMTVPDAIAVIASVTKRFGDRVLVGAGTVTDAATAELAVDAGAAFIVTPCFVPEVIDFARDGDIAVIPGALTPTEILEAFRRGGDMVKVFPVQNVGGAAYLRALRGPLPNIPLVPTGGVSLDTVRDMFDAGAAAIGVGGELISREALARRDYASIGALAADFVAAVRVARGR